MAQRGRPKKEQPFTIELVGKERHSMISMLNALAKINRTTAEKSDIAYADLIELDSLEYWLANKLNASRPDRDYWSDYEAN
jgi:hypothetical protein